MVFGVIHNYLMNLHYEENNKQLSFIARLFHGSFVRICLHLLQNVHANVMIAKSVAKFMYLRVCKCVCIVI